MSHGSAAYESSAVPGQGESSGGLGYPIDLEEPIERGHLLLAIGHDFRTAHPRCSRPSVAPPLPCPPHGAGGRFRQIAASSRYTPLRSTA